MDLSEEIKENIEKYSSNYRLDRLSKYLNYELSSSTFYLGAFFYGILLSLSIIAAAIFTPYMIYVLYLEKKFGWLLAFFLLVILPFIILEIIVFDPIVKPILRMIPIGLFFLYCILLKYSVNDWIRDRSFKRMWEVEKTTKKNEGVF